jgi:hypothetical protein
VAKGRGESLYKALAPGIGARPELERWSVLRDKSLTSCVVMGQALGILQRQMRSGICSSNA